MVQAYIGSLYRVDKRSYSLLFKWLLGLRTEKVLYRVYLQGEGVKVVGIVWGRNILRLGTAGILSVHCRHALQLGTAGILGGYCRHTLRLGAARRARRT